MNPAQTFRGKLVAMPVMKMSMSGGSLTLHIHESILLAKRRPWRVCTRHVCRQVRMMCFSCVLFSIFSVDKDSENLRSSRLLMGNQPLFFLVTLPIEQLSFLPLSQSLQSFPGSLSGLDLPPQALPETFQLHMRKTLLY